MSSQEVAEDAGQEEVQTPVAEPRDPSNPDQGDGEGVEGVEGADGAEGAENNEEKEAQTGARQMTSCLSRGPGMGYCPPRHPAPWRSELLVMVPLPTTRARGYSSPGSGYGSNKDNGSASQEDDWPGKEKGYGSRSYGSSKGNRGDSNGPRRGGSSYSAAESRRTEDVEETKGERERRIRKQLSLGPVGVSAQKGFLVSGPHWLSAGHTKRWPFSSRLQCHLVTQGGSSSHPSRCNHASCWSRAPSNVILNTVPYRPQVK